MKKNNTTTKVDVIFDRKKRVAATGRGNIEVRVYLARKQRKYILVGNCEPGQWETIAASNEVSGIVNKAKEIVAGMKMYHADLTIENFNYLWEGKNPDEERRKKEELRKAEEEMMENKNFISYIKEELEHENIRKGTRKHKEVVIRALQMFGKIKTFADLTPHNIMDFDRWLHSGKRSDVTTHAYHKCLHVWVDALYRQGAIALNPYASAKIRKGKSRERRPLVEKELKALRELELESAKHDKARDLFIFTAYTGLSYIDTQVFDFDSMTIEVNGNYYIDGSRMKTGSRFYTPILEPALEVLRKYNYQLPHISNQKANEYLHEIESLMGINKPLTMHVGRHSFATLVLAHDVPEANVSRMLGHQDLRTTHIYAKTLNTSIERYAEQLQSSIL